MLALPPDPKKIGSRALTSAVLHERPRIVACSAAAGYGKSFLAAELAATSGSSITCDCGQGSLPEFARSIVLALIEEDRSREEALTTLVLGLPDEPQRWAESAVRAWKEATRPSSVVVFEHVEALDAEGRGLLRAILSAPAGRELYVLCSRAALDDVFPARLPPSAIVSLTERDLRLNLQETAAFFDADLDDATLRRVDDVAQGWPLALEVLRSGHRRGRLDGMLRDLHDPQYRAMHAYLAEDILCSLGEPELDVMCALSVLGACTESRLRDALAGSPSGGVDRLRTLPLIRWEHSRVTLHPLVSAFLALRHPERRAAIARAASDALLARGGDRVEAARIAFDGGDRDHAAGILECGGLFLVSPPPPGIADLLARLDRETLLRHPALWSMATLYRVFAIPTDDWLAEARAVWAALPPDAPAETLAGVAINLTIIYAIRGEWEAIDAVQAELAELHGRRGDADRPSVQLLTTLVSGWVRALRMQQLDLTMFMREIAPLLVVDWVHALVLSDVVARVHMGRGDRAAQRRALDEAVIRARRAGVPSVLAICLQEAASAAWLANEMPLFETCTLELEQLDAADPTLTRGVAHFLDCARGRAMNARVGSEKPKTRALSWLMAAGNATSSGERRAFLDQALRTADACRHPHAMILSRLAMTAALPGASHRWSEASWLAETLEAPFMQRLFATGVGAERIEPFLSRFRSEAPPEDRVVVRVLDGAVEADGKPVHLSPKEFSLLALLAITEAPLDTDTLCEALWPDTAPGSAAASLRVYVNRVRTKVGDPRCIEVDKGRYRGASYVRTDLNQIDAFVRTENLRPTRTDINVALRRYAALVAGPPAFLLDLPIFSSLNAYVNDLIERMETWLEAARDRAVDDERARITLALEAVAAS